MNVYSVLEEFVRERQISIFGIASPNGFEHALPGWHPKDLMPRCKSVLVFGRPFIEHPLEVDEKTHIANESWWVVNEGVYCDVGRWRGEMINLFDGFGLGTANFGGFRLTSESTFSYRLTQYETGVGVYGRFGVCLNPNFGCYYFIGVLLTEAELPPSDRGRLTTFNPCDDCSLCAEVCPVKAIDATKAPPKSNNRELCTRFILKMKQRYGDSTKICGRCFSVCPWAKQISKNK